MSERTSPSYWLQANNHNSQFNICQCFIFPAYNFEIIVGFGCHNIFNIWFDILVAIWFWCRLTSIFKPFRSAQFSDLYHKYNSSYIQFPATNSPTVISLKKSKKRNWPWTYSNTCENSWWLWRNLISVTRQIWFPPGFNILVYRAQSLFRFRGKTKWILKADHVKLCTFLKFSQLKKYKKTLGFHD